MRFWKTNALALVLIGFGVANAVLYSSLLPLWEGFDEPLHYCYVQDLSVQHRLPVLGQSLCSQEVGRSLELVPVSHIVKQNMSWLTVYGDYFRLDPAERHRRRQELYSLPASLKQDTIRGLANYEAQQAPLAYLLLAVPDYLWARTPIPERVWRLRVLGAILSTVAVALLTYGLGRRMNLPKHFRHVIVFLVLSTQMFYATTAHIANDWLAVPLAILLFLAAGALYDCPGVPSACVFALALAAGLMTKAYFLSLAPLAFGLVLWLAVKKRLGWWPAAAFFLIVAIVSGPWYARNQILYHSLSATQQSASGLGLSSALRAAPHVNWGAAIATLARTSLWTGNNSDTAFSAKIMAIMWAFLLLSAGLCIMGAMKRRPRFLEGFIVAGATLHMAGIAYAVALLYVYTQGVSRATGQWYTQPVFAPLLCVIFGGLARGAPRLGRVLAALMVCLWGYVIAATYLAKLIPMYGGWEQETVHLRPLIHWYASQGNRITETLGATALAGPKFILSLAAVVAVSAFAIAVVLCTRLLSGYHSGGDRIAT